MGQFLPINHKVAAGKFQVRSMYTNVTEAGWLRDCPLLKRRTSDVDVDLTRSVRLTGAQFSRSHEVSRGGFCIEAP